MYEFLAGAARVNITPPLGVAIEGSFSPVFADHLLDELHAHALVLDDGASEVAWVSVDVCQMPTSIYDDIAGRLARACGLPKQHVFITSTHTHNAATVGGVVMGHEVVDHAYVETMKRQIVSAVQMARQRKQPALLGAAKATNDRHVFNRRLKRPDGSMVMNWFNKALLQDCVPAGPVDVDVHVVKVAHAETRQPLAFIVNHALHNNAASPDKTAISADFSGVMAETLRRVYGDHVVTLFLPGAMGDINWIDHRDFSHDYATLYRQIGLSLAGTVMSADYDMQYVDAPTLDVRQTVLRIAERPWDAGALSDKDVFQLEENLPRSPFFQAHQRWQSQGCPPLQTFDVDLRALVLSDSIAIATNPSEFFVELGMAVKAQSPFTHTLVSTLTNGNVGYVPTRQAFIDGGYETKKYPENSFLDESAGDDMVAASVALLKT